MKPDATDVKESRKLFESLAQFPEQSISTLRYSRLRYKTTSGNFCIPVAINGQPAFYMVDTGANLPVISAAEARRRRLKIAKGGGKLGDSALYSVDVGDVALASELIVGSVRFHNVSFLVMPDDRFEDIPSEQRGVLGLPVLLALQALRWSADGTFEIAFPVPSTRPSIPNLYFDGATPIAQVGYADSKLDFVLDTGAVQTDLYPRFAREFATMVKQVGRPGVTHRVAARGSADINTIILPQLTFRIGAFTARLNPANVFPKNIGSEWHHGNLGLDLLRQATAVTLDFRSMTLALE